MLLHSNSEEILYVSLDSPESSRDMEKIPRVILFLNTAQELREREGVLSLSCSCGYLSNTRLVTWLKQTQVKMTPTSGLVYSTTEDAPPTYTLFSYHTLIFLIVGDFHAHPSFLTVYCVLELQLLLPSFCKTATCRSMRFFP